MKERPILFSTAMVQAILAGRKTMTRRIIKKQPVKQWAVEKLCNEGPGSVDARELTDSDMELDELVEKCPYGKPGDVLWLREEHYRFGKWVRNGQTKSGRDKWKFVAVNNDTIYYSDDMPMAYRKSRDKSYPDKAQWYKRLARFMPKFAARTWLEVTDIRVERLWDITEADVKAEGIQNKPDFVFLWRKINGPESWNNNSWVRVVSFKVLSTTGKPKC